MKIQKKQVIVLVSMCLIVLAGYFQYTYNQTGIATKEARKKEDAVFVNAGFEVKDDKNKPAAISTPSKEADDFFSKARLNREITRGKNRDLLDEVIKNPNTSKSLKDKAEEKLNTLVVISEKEMKIETLIKERGFSDAIALMGEDGSLDIVVKSGVLSGAQVAQIADVASRQANTEIRNIHIRNMY